MKGLCAEIINPASFKSIIAVEPVIRSPPLINEIIEPITKLTIARRNKFQSKAEFKQFLVGKFAYSTWLPDYISLYADHGLFKFSDGSQEYYKFKCDPFHEAATYNGSKTACHLLLERNELIRCP
ncbi:hypothetical protein AYI70_g4684, partial [Smittium culicis]